jgi:hypothetical protein
MLPVQYAREVLRLPFPNPLQSFERRIVSEPFFSLTGKKQGASTISVGSCAEIRNLKGHSHELVPSGEKSAN